MIEKHHVDPVHDRQAWLELRRKDVTASDVAALFGCHPYRTELGLYIEKTGVQMDDAGTSVMRRGRRLEETVAAYARDERPAWVIDKATDYLRDPEHRIGCTRDFLIRDGDRHGVMQTKTVGSDIFKRHWGDVPPMWVILQNLTELMLSDLRWGVIAALVINPHRDFDLHFYDIERDERIERRILEAVDDFWMNTDAGVMPTIDFERDASALMQLYPKEVPRKEIDLTGDNLLPELLEERAGLASAIKVASKRKDEIDACIRSKLGDAEACSLHDWRITLKTRAAYTANVKPSRILKVMRLTDQGDE